MANPPDFEAIARQLAENGTESGIIDPEVIEGIAEQLRLVWKARGAADLAIIESVVTGAMGQPFLKPIGDALVSTLRLGLSNLDLYAHPLMRPQF